MSAKIEITDRKGEGSEEREREMERNTEGRKKK